MSYEVTISEKEWPLRKPFKISREVQTHSKTIICQVKDGAHTGAGEAAGVSYKGETITSIRGQIEAALPQLSAGISRQQLQELMPPGGARNAVDCALWDLEAKKTGHTVWQMLGWQPHAVTTVYTVGIDEPENMKKDAAAHADFPILKVKVGIGDPLEQIAAIREGSPNAAIVIDANQAWTVDDLDHYAAGLGELNVEMIEQPLAIDDDESLRDYQSPIPLCADESCDTRADLERLAGLYDIVNIKLDKTGGLTEAVALALQAESMGFGLMVGNMLGSSLAMAPAFVIAQRCKYVDIDGPLLQAEDCEHALVYDRGRVEPFSPRLWG
ncbi:MAG: N-acetyl-D-Glu racemase DgcA [Woeseiaceae bacterium]|nr:N-acetyl-D-Glu racemase DgcA [Woeseiaceae bacterium]